MLWSECPGQDDVQTYHNALIVQIHAKEDAAHKLPKVPIAKDKQKSCQAIDPSPTLGSV
jgi:hypothetical protein